MGKFGKWYKSRTPREIYADGMGTKFQDADNVRKAIRRVKCFFPLIVQSENQISEQAFFDSRQVMDFCRERTTERWEELSPEEKHRLMKKENEVELCVKLGMSENYATLRCKIVNKILQELGVPGKMSMLESIDCLIDTLDLDNPFGDQVSEEVRNATDWLTYKAFSFRPGNLSQDFQEAADFLEQTRGENSDTGTYYIHGTVGAVLKEVFDDGGKINISTKDGPRGPHDLGDGLYTFLQLLQAISFAVNRAWGFLEEEDSKRDNPAVIVFPDVDEHAEKFHMELIDVNEHRIRNEDQLKESLTPTQYKEFASNRNRWAQHQDTAPISKWMECVALCRKYKFQPRKLHIYHGLLHDCESTSGTNMGFDPVADVDQWKQFCIQAEDSIGSFGHRKFFLEFQLDWDQWVDAKDRSLWDTVKAEMDDFVTREWHKAQE